MVPLAPWWRRLLWRAVDWAQSPPSWVWDGEEQRYHPR
jgi:hypothetical protein